jgi:hypothetical protein
MVMTNTRLVSCILASKSESWSREYVRSNDVAQDPSGSRSIPLVPITETLEKYGYIAENE